MPLRDTKVFFTQVTYARVNANASGRNCVYVTEAAPAHESEQQSAGKFTNCRVVSMSHATLKFVLFKYATFGIKTNVAFTSEYLIHSYKRYFSFR